MSVTSQSTSAPRLKPAQPATRKPTYWSAVDWIVQNDGSAADALAGLKNDPNQAITHDALAGLLTVVMLSDMYGMEPRKVATDIIRSHARDTGL